MLTQLNGGNGRSVAGDDVTAELPNEGVERLRNTNAAVGSLAHALQEAPDPALPIAVAAHGCQPMRPASVEEWVDRLEL